MIIKSILTAVFVLFISMPTHATYTYTAIFEVDSTSGTVAIGDSIEITVGIPDNLFNLSGVYLSPNDLDSFSMTFGAYTVDPTGITADDDFYLSFGTDASGVTNFGTNIGYRGGVHPIGLVETSNTFGFVAGSALGFGDTYGIAGDGQFTTTGWTSVSLISSPPAVPLPASLPLFIAGLTFLGVMRRKHNIVA